MERTIFRFVAATIYASLQKMLQRYGNRCKKCCNDTAIVANNASSIYDISWKKQPMDKKENKALEYKEIVDKSYLKTVSAYANFNDGIIVFGVTDEGTTKGVENPNEECLNIKNQINDSIKPKPDFSLKVNDDSTISLKVYKGQATPYRYNGKCYKRNDSSTIEVDPQTENRLVLEGNNLSFEELKAKDQNCVFSILSEHLKKAINIDNFNTDTLKSLNLLGKEGYNNAASLLADNNHFPGIDIVVFGSSINEIKKRHTLSNVSVLKQYLDAIKIFEDQYIVERIDGGFREKCELIPFEAFREVIANAIIHRAYDVSPNSKVEMYSDKIVISSPGGLMPMMDLTAFLAGRYSCLRNPILANVFHRLNIVEMFATGIKRINESYIGSATRPIYDVSDSCVSITLPVKKEIELSKNEKIALKCIEMNREYTRGELENSTGLKKDTLIRTLNSLVSKNLLAKSGGAMNITYRRSR